MGRWPMGQPPGREVSARPSRASSGAQKRMEARIRAAASPGRVLHTGVPLTTTSAPCRRASHPAPRSSARQHSTSDRAGTARSRTVPRQSSAAARSGSTLFFAAGTAAVPFSGLPPITQIRPLLYIGEQRSANLARQLELPVVKSTCPMDHTSKRQEIKDLLTTLSAQYPDLRSKVFGAMQRLPLDGWGPTPHERIKTRERKKEE